MDASFLLDPAKLSVIAVLGWLVYAFVVETVVPGRRHRRDLQRAEENCAKQIGQLREENVRILKERNDMGDELRQQTNVNRRALAALGIKRRAR